jgi:GNAT superfamily N-acetyltransferase
MRTEVRFLTADDWELWRDLRLRSLADEPEAYGSTYEREATYDEAAWREWVEHANAVVVFDDGTPVACGGALVTDAGEALVIAMWVAEDHRGRGLSRLILDAVVGWARDRAVPVVIGVNRANPVARAAYLSYGFVPTGESEPLREGSDAVCDVMRLP